VVSKRILLVTIASAMLAAGSVSAQKRAPIRVEIADFVYLKPAVNAKVGDTIEWVNKDIVDHTATEKQKLWDVSMATGKAGQVVMKKAGTFDYYCRYHPNMVAKLVVAAAKK
jgi:plastocyanin